MTGRLCALQGAVGRVETCRGDRCPFWEPGGAVLAGGCVVERLSLDLERRPDLVHYLLDLRLALDEGRADPPGTRQLFYRLSREPSPAAFATIPRKAKAAAHAAASSRRRSPAS